MPINLKKMTQPYLASEDEMQDLLMPVRTDAQLALATSPVNVIDKYTGKVAFNSDLGKPVFAVSGVASSAWLVAEATPAVATTVLADETETINTIGKYAGKMAWDVTKGQPVWADGAGVNDTWSLSTGIVASTPA